MGVFEWNEKYSVNIREIDEEHKKLIGLVGQLNSAMRQGKGKDALGKVLYDLIQYTRTHFADEERIMKSGGYPDYQDHKAKHDWMTNRVAAIYKDYQEGKTTITIEVMSFLEQWVEKHIMGTDKKYGPYLNAKGIS
ncbi:MAG: bacteriohemerythrin [Syntrophobacteraceae bacterium]